MFTLTKQRVAGANCSAVESETTQKNGVMPKNLNIRRSRTNFVIFGVLLFVFMGFGNKVNAQTWDIGNSLPAIYAINLSEYCTPTNILSSENQEGVAISWSGAANSYNIKVYTASGNINLSQTGDVFDGEVPSYGTFAFKLFDAGELTENTRYVVYVQGVCDDGMSEWMQYTFKTDLTATAMPYCTDFENNADNNKWAISSNDCANVWTFGSTANNGGSQSMYISNDGGISHTYNTDSTSASYAYKIFEIQSSREHEISFDWRAQGESSVDYLRVFLIPETPANITKLELANTNGITATEIPEGWIALDGENKLNLSNGWRTRNVAFQAPLQGRHFLAFLWKNNEISGTQPPAAIDNLCIKRFSCVSPNDLRLLGITKQLLMLSGIIMQALLPLTM